LIEEKPKIVFDNKFRTVVKCVYSERYPEILDWLHSNTSGAVDIKLDYALAPDVRPMDIFVGFENVDDALVFKIKFSI